MTEMMKQLQKIGIIPVVVLFPCVPETPIRFLKPVMMLCGRLR